MAEQCHLPWHEAVSRPDVQDKHSVLLSLLDDTLSSSQ